MSYDAWKTTDPRDGEPEAAVYDEPPVCDCCGRDFVDVWLGLPGAVETKGVCERCAVVLAMSLPDERAENDLSMAAE